jgi:hypothetical protein
MPIGTFESARRTYHVCFWHKANIGIVLNHVRFRGKSGHLFRLTPDGGLYVRGFGQAFEISPDMKNSQRVTGNSSVQEPVGEASKSK